MGSILLAALLIIIPAIGMLLGLFLSRLEDSYAAEGKTRDWILFIFIFVPTVIISFMLFNHLHTPASYEIEWLPGISIGLRVNEVAIVFATIITSLSALLALYSINYMTYDQHRSRYWFFYQLVLTAMMMVVFSNNLFWLFGGIEVAAIAAFFLISHWHRKSGEEGEKAGKAAIRYLIMSVIGDIFILIGFSFILVAFNTPNIDEVISMWMHPPLRIIGKSSSATRLLIKMFIAIGALIKSAQIPILLWPIGGSKKDYDLAKAPLPVATNLVAISVGNIGIYLLCSLYPLFSRRGTEIGTGVPIFHEAPFILIGWFAIISLFVVIGMLLFTKNINRVAIGAAIAQMSFALLGFSSASKLGFTATVFQLITGIPTVIALSLVFGMVIESLRIKDLSRVCGLKDKYPLLHLLGIFSLISYLGIFPSGMYFSKDMIFEALRTSGIFSSFALMILGILGSLLLAFALTKIFMKIFYGQMGDEYSMRPLNSVSITSTGISLGWAMVSGLALILVGYPSPYLFSGLLGKQFELNYGSPFTANLVTSPIVLGLTITAFLIPYFLYRDGSGSKLEKLRNSKVIIALRSFFVSGFYLDTIYETIIFKPINFLSKLVAWTRIKAPFASVVWAVLSVALLVSIFALVGGLSLG
ncbi:MAG: proton-conducting transporter transmembrane domain-containing protein [Candidatus Heimdallarchaeota archaeon]